MHRVALALHLIAQLLELLLQPPLGPLQLTMLLHRFEAAGVVLVLQLVFLVKQEDDLHTSLCQCLPLGHWRLFHACARLRQLALELCHLLLLPLRLSFDLQHAAAQLVALQLELDHVLVA